jgi:hypothetical protein
MKEEELSIDPDYVQIPLIKFLIDESTVHTNENKSP